MEFFKSSRQDFLSAWAGMAARNPWLALKAYFDRTAIIWRVTNPPDCFVFTSTRGIPKNVLGFQMQSQLPIVNKVLNKLLQLMDSRHLIGIFWKTATYMLILMLFGFAAIMKNGFKWALLLVPAVGNTLGLLIVTTSAQPRYYYITLLAAPLIVAVAFHPGKKGKTEGGLPGYEADHTNSLL